MGDKRTYYDEYENKQYYLNENGDRVYIVHVESRRDNSTKIAVISGIFVVIAAVIGILPLISVDLPTGETRYISVVCILFNSPVVQSVFNCGNHNSSIEIAVAATLTAISSTPDRTPLMPTSIVVTTTPYLQPVSTSETMTAMPMPTVGSILATATPIRIAAIEVEANLETGVRFPCPATGNYQLVLEGGAYSPWPNGASGQWRTMVYAYINHEIVWNQNQYGFVAPAPIGTPSRDIAAVGRMEIQTDDTMTSAETRGRGDYDMFYCQAGQTILFVTMDERRAYGDNFGSVTLGLYALNT